MASNVTSSSAVDRSILVTDIPCYTDDIEKQKDGLEKYFRKRKFGGGDVQRVICPFGGSIYNALIVFESEKVMDTILNHTHQLGEEETQVTRLPPSFTEVRGILDDFYFSILSRNRFRELVKQLGKFLGADNIQAKKSKVTEVTGTMDHLKEAAECVLEAIGMTGVQDVSDSAYITERCLHIDNIPFVTGDVTQMKEELGEFFKENGDEVHSVISPIIGTLTRAIVIFKSVQDRNHFLQHGDHSFFENTLNVQEMPQIEQIQNKELYIQYKARKDQMKARLGRDTELTMYHGSSENTVDKINKRGFNRSYCRKNAVAFGKGTYFARDASYSAKSRYSPPGASGHRFIYMCKVLVGDCARGDSSMIEPPQKPHSSDIYDSTVNDVNTLAIVVIYHDVQAYPEYLITFQ